MPFPELEISHGGTFAFITTVYNQLRIHQVKPIYGRIFFVKDLGVYQLNEEYRYLLGRAEIYWYTQKGINPLSLRAVVDLQKFISDENKQELDINDLAAIVDKIRKVEQKKKLIEQLEGQYNATSDQIKEYEASGELENTVNKILANANGKGYEKLDKRTKAWLNAYFKEDINARFYLEMAMLADEKFKLPTSPQVRNFMPLQKTMAKKNVALIILNDSRIIVDSSVSVEMDYNKGFFVLKTKEYGDFDIIEAKTRYKYGRQNIFVAMVETGIAKPAEVKEAEKVAPMVAGGNGK